MQQRKLVLVSSTCAVYQQDARICWQKLDLLLMGEEEVFDVIVAVLFNRENTVWRGQIV